jgi:hypoxanthine phosphoribosyltransferase
MEKKRVRKGKMVKLEFEKPTWEKIQRYAQNLGGKIQRSKFNPDIIVGISRGGWIPARIISDFLENPRLANISVKFYETIEETKKEPIITQPISLSIENKRILLVDDVADTGKSLEFVKKDLETKDASEIRIATLYYKPWSIIDPDYYEKQTKLWIIFPWEQKESVKKISKKLKEQKIDLKEIRNKLIQLGLDRTIIESHFKENS